MGFRGSEFHFVIVRDEIINTIFHKHSFDSNFFTLDFEYVGFWIFALFTLNLLYRFSILLATSTSATNKL